MVLWISNHTDLVLEILAVVFGVAYVILAALKNKWCWPFGIVGSAVSIVLFVAYSKLYAEAVLYLYYVVAGFMGWIAWQKQTDVSGNDIVSKPYLAHISIVVVGTLLSFMFYYGLSHFFPSAQRPLFDSFTTIFSFIATWLTVKKWIENWLYWIVINIASMFLYYSRGLEIYTYLMLLNALIAIYGFAHWYKLKRHA